MSPSTASPGLKNIQVVDGAENATYSIFQATEEEFTLIFPGAGQDLEVIEDLFRRAGVEAATAALASIWARPVRKRDAQGIHGTLFYGYEADRMHLPSSKSEIDRDPRQLDRAQRELYARWRTSRRR